MVNRKSSRKVDERDYSGAGVRLTTPAVIALACVVVLTGLITTWMAPSASMESASDALRISEIMTSNGSALVQADGSLPDWIEVENTSNVAVDLTGYALVTEAKPSNAFAFPGGMLAPGARVVVYCDDSGKSLVGGEYHAPFKLSSGGENLALLNKRGQAVDVVAVPSLARDQVYCRDGSGEWQISDFATPGEPNRAEREDLEGENVRQVKVVKGAVEISEVMTRNVTFFPDENGENPDYIEVHNTTGSPVSLEGWSLSDSRDKLRKWSFPAVTLPANGYIAVHCSGVDRTDDPRHIHASFKLNRNGEELYLTDPNGATTSYVKVPMLLADEAYSLTETGWSKSQAPSPGLPNDQSGADAAADAITMQNSYGVYITEVLATSNQSNDWIEIYNASNQSVDLSGFGLSDNAAKPRKWQFPGGTVIQPGAYMGIYADRNATAGDGSLHADFRLDAQGGYSITLADPAGGILDRKSVV